MDNRERLIADMHAMLRDINEGSDVEDSASMMLESLEMDGWRFTRESGAPAQRPRMSQETFESSMHCEQPFDVMSTIDHDFADSFNRAPEVADAGAVAWSASKHDEIIKQLMEGIGQPNSMSVYGAFKQFANELHALASPSDAGMRAGLYLDDNDTEWLCAEVAGKVMVAKADNCTAVSKDLFEQWGWRVTSTDGKCGA